MMMVASAAAVLMSACVGHAGPAGAGAPASSSAGSPCGTLASPPTYKHVIWIWMENHSFGSIIGSSSAPYITKLANQCGLAVNYHNITHPSLPNYVGATSGLGYPGLARFGSDCDPVGGCVTSASSIFGQGESWRAYDESMPAPCTTSNAGEYAVRHNPPPYFTSLKSCKAFDVPLARFHRAVTTGKLPAFSFVTPNLIDDMHDGTVADGNRWLAGVIPMILSSPQYRDGSTAVFITWDEGEGGSATQCATNSTDVGCHIAAIVISPSTKPGTRSSKLFNHYALLGTTEQLLGLPRLGLAASTPTMTSAFGL
jgi:hypothetical protein